MNDGGGKACAVAAILAVDVLNHLLAPFMLEIDIDIGRLFALFRNEAIEQQLVLGGVDTGNFEAITHGRVGSRTAPLAQNGRINAARIVDDILDGEEVPRQLQFADQCQFAFKRFRHRVW